MNSWYIVAAAALTLAMTAVLGAGIVQVLNRHGKN